MITCPKCSKDNQDHYKFCLGCGAELPRDAAPKPFTPQTPSQGVKAGRAPARRRWPRRAAPSRRRPRVAAAAAGAGGGAATAAAASLPLRPAPPHPPRRRPSAGGRTSCPQCGHVNTPSNLFCGSCGFRLGGAARPPPKAASPRGSAGARRRRARSSSPRSAPTAAKPARTRCPPAPVTVGRETGSIFAGDSYLSPRHATFKQDGRKVTVKDEASLNGVYKKLVRDVPVELRPHDMFRIGQEIIKFEPLQPDARRRRRRAPRLARRRATSGASRSSSAATSPATPSRSRRPACTSVASAATCSSPKTATSPACTAASRWEGGRLHLTDLGSSNGTFMRLREETEVKSGDVLLMGQQLFRVAV